jgi:hypothetical protein
LISLNFYILKIDVSTINIKVVVCSSEISGITKQPATRFLTVVKRKGKVTPKQAYVALRDPGG